MSESGKAAPQSYPSPNDGDAPTPTPTPTPAKDGDGDGDRVEQLDFANPTLSIIARNASSSRRPSYSTIGATSTSPSREGTPPPLPPRPQLQLGVHSSRPPSSHSVRRTPSRPQLVSKATTQLSITNTQAFGSDSRDDAASLAPAQPRLVLPTLASEALADAEDDTSVKSDVPTISEVGGESMLGEIVAATEKKSEHDEVLLRSLGRRFEDAEAQSLFPPDPDFEAAFDQEFDDVADMAADGSNEGQLCLKPQALAHTTC